MRKRQYRRFTKKFKLEAVRLMEAAGQPVTQVARELGIRVNQLYKWQQQLRDKAGDASPGQGRQLGQDAELTELRRENERLEEEVPILKEAAGDEAKVSG